MSSASVQPRPDPSTLPGQSAPPRSVYRPLWWLPPFLGGLAVGLIMWGMVHTINSAAQHQIDRLKELEGHRP